MKSDSGAPVHDYPHYSLVITGPRIPNRRDEVLESRLLDASLSILNYYHLLHQPFECHHSIELGPYKAEGQLDRQAPCQGDIRIQAHHSSSSRTSRSEPNGVLTAEAVLHSAGAAAPITSIRVAVVTCLPFVWLVDSIATGHQAS